MFISMQSTADLLLIFNHRVLIKYQLLSLVTHATVYIDSRFLRCVRTLSHSHLVLIFPEK